MSADRCTFLLLAPAAADALLAHLHAELSPPDAERWDRARPHPTDAALRVVPVDPRARALTLAWLVAEGHAEDPAAAEALLLANPPEYPI